MPDDVVKVGDTVIFDPSFNEATAIGSLSTKIIKGDATALINSKEYCSASNASDVAKLIRAVQCTYIASGFDIPGNAELHISSLNDDQLAKKCEISKGKKAILKGIKFKAVLVVTSGATNSATAAKDFSPLYTGTGSFQTTNVELKAE